MKDISIETMQRYLRRYKGRGVFLERWHRDMKCYIVNENLADHVRPSIETPEARIARIPDIQKERVIRSDGRIYSRLGSWWVRFKMIDWWGTIVWRVRYKIYKWRI